MACSVLHQIYISVPVPVLGLYYQLNSYLLIHQNQFWQGSQTFILIENITSLFFHQINKLGHQMALLGTLSWASWILCSLCALPQI